MNIIKYLWLFYICCFFFSFIGMYFGGDTWHGDAMDILW